MIKGYLLLIGGYIGWGLFPLYWSLTAHVPPVEVTLHRMIWALPVLALMVWRLPSRRAVVGEVLRQPTSMRYLLFTTALISTNWLVYVWAVSHQQVLQASMGYFLTPLLNVAGAVLVFHERLDPLKKWAIVCAMLGVAYYISRVDGFPWVAIVLGLSFALYGIVRKKAAVDSVPGLFIETLIAGPVAVLYLLFLLFSGKAAFLHGPPLDDLWLVLGGLVTVIPLALFNAGAKLLPMATVGILFYLTPTLQFLSGTLIFHEPVDTDKLIGFAGIWLGLLLYAWSLLRSTRGQAPR
ncbi:EamA family transporter RarD [Granulosicoccaceae sp. 1_MG-2023]|nr:EamA family transporter RarD [Granulosicoccaceae sp. 1_MG-2023]